MDELCPKGACRWKKWAAIAGQTLLRAGAGVLYPTHPIILFLSFAKQVNSGHRA
jgi:hypothetical protein